MRQVDEFDGDINISTMIDRPYWARGMASELVQYNLNYAFYELQLDVVYAAARLYGGASVRLMELKGFVHQPDCKLRDWDVFYSVCPRETIWPSIKIEKPRAMFRDHQGPEIPVRAL